MPNNDFLTTEDMVSLFDNKSYPFFGVCQDLFKLGNVVFEARADPADGYRSYFDGFYLNTDENVTFSNVKITNLYCKIDPDPDSNCVQFYDEDNHVWLTIGTGNIGDWYPYCIFSYTPPISQFDTLREKMNQE